MAESVCNVLFLYTGNSARSILAESIMRRDGADHFQTFSAGSQRRGDVNPLAIQTLERLHYPTDGLCSKSRDEFELSATPKMDFVFTICDSAAGETYAIWPRQPIRAHWGIADPSMDEGTDIEKLAAFAMLQHTLTLQHLGPSHGASTGASR
jgi:arsenate reductase